MIYARWQIAAISSIFIAAPILLLLGEGKLRPHAVTVDQGGAGAVTVSAAKQHPSTLRP